MKALDDGLNTNEDAWPCELTGAQYQKCSLSSPKACPRMKIEVEVRWDKCQEHGGCIQVRNVEESQLEKNLKKREYRNERNLDLYKRGWMGHA